MFNAYAATNPRLNRKAHSEPRGTKPLVSPVSVTKEELKAMAEQTGWDIRELTYDEVERMSSSELRFHEVFNRQNLDRAFELERNKRLNRERTPIWDIRKKWEGKTLVTPEEAEEAHKAGATFAERHPTFERNEENALAICGYMSEHHLDPKQVSSYVTAFNALVEAGQMKLAPVLSADEFLVEHAHELVDQRVPPLIQARHTKAENTQKFFEKAQAATAEGTTVRVLDYPHEQRGVPPQPEKHSFRMKVRSMSASEIAQRCADDPVFKAALDALD